MTTAFKDLDISALSPVQKMEIADMLYDVAMQEIEASPLSQDQLDEINRRMLAADRSSLLRPGWESVFANFKDAL